MCVSFHVLFVQSVRIKNMTENLSLSASKATYMIV
jgi:hypothetical protein